MCKYVTSVAEMEGEMLTGIKYINRKSDALQLGGEESVTMMAIGDGMNDIDMIRSADVGILLEEFIQSLMDY